MRGTVTEQFRCHAKSKSFFLLRQLKPMVRHALSIVWVLHGKKNSGKGVVDDITALFR